MQNHNCINLNQAMNEIEKHNRKHWTSFATYTSEGERRILAQEVVFSRLHRPKDAARRNWEYDAERE